MKNIFFKYKEFIIFVLSGGTAAMANLISRYFFFMIMPYSLAIVLAHFVGMVVAFLLFKFVVFSRGNDYGSAREYIGFVLINVVTLFLTLTVSLLFANYIFPYMGMTWYPHDVAHFLGVSAPVITSYYGHKYITFGGKKHAA